MKDRFVFFLPTRKGSQRVKNKNTRPFAGIEGGLLSVKLKQLLDVRAISKIVLSTNDEESVKVALSFKNDRIIIVERPEKLCLSSTSLEDLIDYVPTVTNADHIFWTHTTSPFVSSVEYEKALEKYEKSVIRDGLYDSLLSVTKIQQFIWSKKDNKCINYDQSITKWPRTQDLEPLFAIDSAFFINSALNYSRHHDRIGLKPYLYELNKLNSFDIDWEEDFTIAERLYSQITPPPPTS
jgi:N-acylneuraminate cytidylyltransferase